MGIEEIKIKMDWFFFEIFFRELHGTNCDLLGNEAPVSFVANGTNSV